MTDTDCPLCGCIVRGDRGPLTSVDVLDVERLARLHDYMLTMGMNPELPGVNKGVTLTREPGLREVAERIAALTEDEVRDYEQGLCFFCGSSQEVVPGPRGGVTGQRSHRPRHEADCSYIALRAALASKDRP